MREYRADLHVHTVLSACAEVEMLPPLIVEEALFRGINMLAVTDHNATGNVAAVMEAAQGTDLIVLPGMELQTREEVDVLCIFDTLEQTATWQSHVDERLPPLENDAEHFGPQFLVDAQGDFVGEDTRMRQMPASLGLEDAVRTVHDLGGLAIPAHIDRQVKGLLGVLGMWPGDLAADAAEVSPNIRPSQVREQFLTIPKVVPLITNSDAHFLDALGSVITIFVLANRPFIAELRQAFRGEAGRRVYVP